MDRSATIEEILKLTSATEIKGARAGRLLSKLPDEELRITHEGLVNLRDAGGRVLAGLTPEKRKIFDDLVKDRGIRTEAALTTMERVRDRANARQKERATSTWAHDLIIACESVERWPVFVPIVVDPGRLSLNLNGGISPSADTITPEPQELLAANKELSARMGHPLMWSNAATLDRAQAIEALARVENHLVRHRPDLIVAMNAEGDAMSHLIARDLGLEVPIAKISGTADQTLTWTGEIVQPAKIDSVCILGHLAWSGATIRQAVDVTRQTFGSEIRIDIAVLASSTQAVEQETNAQGFTFHQVTTAPKIMMTFDPTHYRVVGDRFVFAGTTAAAATVSISRSELADARVLVMKTWPSA